MNWFEGDASDIFRIVGGSLMDSTAASAREAVVDTCGEFSEMIAYLASGGSGVNCECVRRTAANSGPVISKARDVCFPVYFTTQVRELEVTREKMTLSLLGQIVVVTCRVLSCDFGGALLGTVVFVVGNQARCSLQATRLTGYVVAGYAMGCLDVMELFHYTVQHGLSVYMMPFSCSMYTNLNTFSRVLAPLVEVGGARLAYNSYLEPSMLFTVDNGQSAAPTARQARHLQNGGGSQYWFSTPAIPGGSRNSGYSTPKPDDSCVGGWYRSHGGGTGSTGIPAPVVEELLSDTRGSGSAGASWSKRKSQRDSHSAASSQVTVLVDSDGERDNGEVADRRSVTDYMSSWAANIASVVQNRVAESPEAEQVELACQQCGRTFFGDFNSRGSGNYATQSYCDVCWNSWGH